MIYAWKVIGWIDGHPAGHVGTYRTKTEADNAARRTRVTTRIKRVRVPDDYFALLPRGLGSTGSPHPPSRPSGTSSTRT